MLHSSELVAGNGYKVIFLKREWNGGIILHPPYGRSNLAEYLRDLRYLGRICFTVVDMKRDSVHGIFRYRPFSRHKGEKVSADGLGVIESQCLTVSGDGL